MPPVSRRHLGKLHSNGNAQGANEVLILERESLSTDTRIQFHDLQYVNVERHAKGLHAEVVKLTGGMGPGAITHLGAHVFDEVGSAQRLLPLLAAPSSTADVYFVSDSTPAYDTFWALVERVQSERVHGGKATAMAALADGEAFDLLSGPTAKLRTRTVGGQVLVPNVRRVAALSRPLEIMQRTWLALQPSSGISRGGHVLVTLDTCVIVGALYPPTSRSDFDAATTSIVSTLRKACAGVVPDGSTPRGRKSPVGTEWKGAANAGSANVVGANVVSKALASYVPKGATACWVVVVPSCAVHCPLSTDDAVLQAALSRGVQRTARKQLLQLDTDDVTDPESDTPPPPTAAAPLLPYPLGLVQWLLQKQEMVCRQQEIREEAGAWRFLLEGHAKGLQLLAHRFGPRPPPKFTVPQPWKRRVGAPINAPAAPTPPPKKKNPRVPARRRETAIQFEAAIAAAAERQAEGAAAAAAAAARETTPRRAPRALMSDDGDCGLSVLESFSDNNPPVAGDDATPRQHVPRRSTASPTLHPPPRPPSEPAVADEGVALGEKREAEPTYSEEFDASVSSREPSQSQRPRDSFASRQDSRSRTPSSSFDVREDLASSRRSSEGIRAHRPSVGGDGGINVVIQDGETTLTHASVAGTTAGVVRRNLHGFLRV